MPTNYEILEKNVEFGIVYGNSSAIGSCFHLIVLQSGELAFWCEPCERLILPEIVTSHLES